MSEGNVLVFATLSVVLYNGKALSSYLKSEDNNTAMCFTGHFLGAKAESQSLPGL